MPTKVGDSAKTNIIVPDKGQTASTSQLQKHEREVHVRDADAPTPDPPVVRRADPLDNPALRGWKTEVERNTQKLDATTLKDVAAQLSSQYPNLPHGAWVQVAAMTHGMLVVIEGELPDAPSKKSDNIEAKENTKDTAYVENTENTENTDAAESSESSENSETAENTANTANTVSAANTAKKDTAMIHICFVCLGNICRSPTAEGIMKQLVAEAGLNDIIQVESAATGGWHAGELPDPRTRATAQKRGLNLTSRARKFLPEDFARFEYIISMDKTNLAVLQAILEADPSITHTPKLALLRSFDPASAADADVPDPYHDNGDGFERVFDLCEAACRGLLAHLQRDEVAREAAI